MSVDPELDGRYPIGDANPVALGIRTLARILAVAYPDDYLKLWVHLDQLVDEIQDEE